MKSRPTALIVVGLLAGTTCALAADAKTDPKPRGTDVPTQYIGTHATDGERATSTGSVRTTK